MFLKRGKITLNKRSVSVNNKKKSKLSKREDNSCLNELRSSKKRRAADVSRKGSQAATSETAAGSSRTKGYSKWMADYHRENRMRFSCSVSPVPNIQPKQNESPKSTRGIRSSMKIKWPRFSVNPKQEWAYIQSMKKVSNYVKAGYSQSGKNSPHHIHPWKLSNKSVNKPKPFMSFVSKKGNKKHNRSFVSNKFLPDTEFM